MDYVPSSNTKSIFHGSEVQILRQLLTKYESQRDSDDYRCSIQKVIASMTQGVDVSSLFSEMVKASATQDIRQKKLVYVYICRYAEYNQQLSILTVNTLQKDMLDQNPTIRGLALRSLCSLKLTDLPHYVREPLKLGLLDKSSYVRKTAVLGVSKLYKRHKELIDELNLIEVLYNMLNDSDPQVIVNCINALNELLYHEGGIVINSKLAFYLLERLTEFSEWGQCTIFDNLDKYHPENEDEILQILNILDERLEHPNSSVFMAATKLFISLIEETPNLRNDVACRIRPILINLLSLSNNSEICYSILVNVEMLLDKLPELDLTSDYKIFLCRYSDPTYLKVKKIFILAKLICEHNMYDILNELSEYALDSNIEVGKRSVVAIKTIAMGMSKSLQLCIDKLSDLMTLDHTHIITEVLLSLSDIVRIYPDISDLFITKLPQLVSIVNDCEKGKSSIIWLIGEVGSTLPDAPYILEDIFNYINKDTSPLIKLNLLSACMKLFFRGRSPEMQLILGKLIHYCIEEEMDIDVHNRALFYYRLLQNNVSETHKIFSSTCTLSSEMSYSDFNKRGNIDNISEFNTLSLVYGKLPQHFIINNAKDIDEYSTRSTDNVVNSLSLIGEDSNISNLLSATTTTTTTTNNNNNNNNSNIIDDESIYNPTLNQELISIETPVAEPILNVTH